MSAIKVVRTPDSRLCQGDVLRKVAAVESVIELDGEIEIVRVQFPLVIVLTQDCDLSQEHTARRKQKGDDKWLLSALVAPLYNVEHVYSGQHLSHLGYKMQTFNKEKTDGKKLRQNETPRYHYLEFPSEVRIVPSVIDFKHYFSVNVLQLEKLKPTHFACQLDDLYREDVSQRFASYLSRIGLPDP